MHILLIGSGGREHALAWRLAQSPGCTRLSAAPGNPGIAEHAALVPLDVSDHNAVIDFCRAQGVDLVVVGPEGPLVAGLADDVRAAGIAIFGPGKDAAQLEGSKGFTKDLCRAAGIPTAAYGRFTTKAAALAGLADYMPPYVIKADGLAAGKGVIIAEDLAQAHAAIDDMFGGGFGDAGAAVVIEDFMTGEEVSFFALCDGQHVVPFGSAQDHKRVGDGDTGPNTGGMGAYSPTGAFTPAMEDEVMARIIRPTVAALADAGMPYQGVLFAGLMLTAQGPQLIEYNCRFGDPECQVLMARFSGDLAALLHAVATGTLGTMPAPLLDADSAVTIVVAARGYPGQPATGGAIRGLDAISGNGLQVFQAGTRVGADGQLVAAGGRVLAVTATAATVGAARDHAYHAVNAIQFDDALYRRDIGWREMARRLPQ